MNTSEKTPKNILKSKAIHKDLDPNNTVSRIRERLARVGLSITEPVKIDNRFDNCWSCIIKDYGYTLLSAGGKGTSKQYALASAYAEYIERLQCYAHEQFGRHGILNFKGDLHPDTSYIDKYKLIKQYPVMLYGLDPENISADELPCLPFSMPFEGKVDFLPYELMLSATRSTGMCAGNSPEEAICQGICEIMERYAFQAVAMRDIASFPTVPLERLRIKDPWVLNSINEFKSKNIEIILKDCTFNGRFPVIAVVLIDKKSGHCGVGFGSDPVFETAFQRCITEIYQIWGNDEASFFDLCNNPCAGKDLFNHPARLVKYLLEGTTVTSSYPTTVFAPAGMSNKYYLKHLLDILDRDKKTICIRDCSFLGVPTYYIFIPGLSFFPPALDDLALSFKDPNLILEILSRMNDNNAEEMTRKLVGIVSCYVENNNPFSVDILGLMDRALAGTPVSAWIGPIIFMAFVFIENKDFKLALEVLDKSKNVFSDLINILKRYCQMLIQSKSTQQILQQLENEFQESDYYDCIGLLVKGYYSSFYHKTPQERPLKKFDNLPLPLCANSDGCSSCLCKTYCCVDKFIDIRDKLLKTYTECDQHKLLLYIKQIMKHF